MKMTKRNQTRPLVGMNKVAFKVSHHTRNTNPGQQTGVSRCREQNECDDILLNAKDIPPGLKEHGVVEVNRVGDDFKLLLQVRSLNNELPARGTVSLESSVASYFQFRLFSFVEISPISSHHVTLELVELGFRDQYFSRSDYFRFAASMRNTVVYSKKKIEFLGILKSIVSDMWMRGERVSSGFIGADTKIIFRSSTAVVHIFLQISEEMWNFDYFGDVYFEKAVSGFLAELCEKWVENNCSHDVTIVLFSRLFYEANSLEDFPEQARHCLLKDHRGRFYEDYFNVIIQNERYTEEWTSVLSRLKLSFNEYRESVLRKHQRHFPGMPKARLSTAAEGNFLETLNMALNLYQAYNIDRNFDRTGKICVIITPGAGVFEVDRALFNVTKQRVLDLGVGADLVCLGTQPLHAVPLFTFVDKAKASISNDYNIPHWINHSFYRSKSELAFRKKYNFIPRISLQLEEMPQDEAMRKLRNAQSERHHELIDFDDHDARVFARVSHQPRRGHVPGARRLQRTSHRDRHSSDCIPPGGRMPLMLSGDSLVGNTTAYERRGSGTEQNSVTGSVEVDVGGSAGEEEMSARHVFTESAEAALDRPVVGSAEMHGNSGPLHRGMMPRKALLNPFAPNRLNIKMTANRRRWAHVFPTDKAGGIVQLHHQRDNSFDNCLAAENKRISLAQLCGSPPVGRKKTLSIESDSVYSRTMSQHDAGDTQDSRMEDYRFLSPVQSVQSLNSSVADKHNLRPSELINGNHTGPPAPMNEPTRLSGTFVSVSNSSMAATLSGTGTATTHGPASAKKFLSHKAINSIFKEGEQKWVWGPLGEQEVSPINSMATNATPDCVSLLIGVDWKSLITPACMPVTTDYFPSSQSLYSDFFESNYTVDPSAINTDSIRSYEMASELQKATCRKPLTAREVFEELVLQRLGLGYQLIVSNSNNLSVGTKAGATIPRRSGPRNNSDSAPETYQLSQGRLFHTLSLNGDIIKVLIHGPSRYDMNPKGISYCYRLMVPDAQEYAISSTTFCSEKLEQFAWNLLDNFICTRGEGESYASMEKFKFWRSRFFLLPFNNPATKKLLDNLSTDPNLHFDIYEPRSDVDNRQLLEGLMKFADIVNKFRRVDSTGQAPNQARKSAKNTNQKRGSIVQLTSPRTPQTRSSSACGERAEADYRATPQPTPPSTPSPKWQINRTSRNSSSKKSLPQSPPSVPVSPRAAVTRREQNPSIPAGKILKFSFDTVDTNRFRDSVESSPVKGQTNQGGPSAPEAEEELSLKTPYSKLLNVMMNESLLFLSHVKNAFPPHTFVAADAVYWLMSNVADIENDIDHAISIMKDMLKQRYIIHASGNPKHPFIHGFYFYSILPPATSDMPRRDSDSSLRNLSPTNFDPNYCFQRDWTEVAFPLTRPTPAPAVPFLAPELPSECLDNFVDKEFAEQWCDQTAISYFCDTGNKDLLMDVEGPNREKLSRPEWVMWQYAANYDPRCAFNLELHWLIATGGRLNEIITIWRKKVSQLCGLHLLPVPCNQFALPSSQECDSLRGPIFIHLEVEHIQHSREDGQELFAEFPAESRKRRLSLFQESILLRFGFLHDGIRQRDAADEERTYVHCSGGMFVMIPDYSNIENRCMFGPRTNERCTRVRLASTQDFSRRNSIIYERRAESLDHPLPLSSVRASEEEHEPLSFEASRDAKSEQELSEEEGKNTEGMDAGFIWAWNYMLTKRWRSQSTGDEMFQDRILADFRAFCSNKENRLVDYWRQCEARISAENVCPVSNEASV